ncbi:MAG: calcium-binding protein [bacterium]
MTDTIFLREGDPNQVSAIADYTRTESAIAGIGSGAYVITWTQEPWGTGQPETTDIYAQLFNADGSENGAAFLVNTTTPDNHWEPDVAGLNNGDFIIAWSSESASNQDGDGAGVYFQRYNNSGVAQGSETLVNTTTSDDQTTPTIVALSTGGFNIVWVENAATQSSLKMQRFFANGTANGGELTLETEAHTGNVSFSAPEVVELTGGKIAASWTRYDSSDDAYAQLGVFNANGTAVSSPISPEQTSDSGFSLPQTQIVELGNGNVLVAYMYSHNTTGAVNVGYGEVYGRIYDATGTAVANEFVIAAGTDNRRFDLFAESDGDGGAMVGYVEEAASVNERALLAQNVDQNGNVLGDPIWLNANQGGQSRNGALAVLDTGDIVSAFQDSGSGARSYIWQQLIRNGDDARFDNSANTVTLNNTGEHVAALDGADNVTGGTGDDVIGGGTGEDILSGGDGNDSLLGGADGDTINGDAGDDYLVGGDGVDILDGGIDNDTLDGGAGDDTLDGGDGDDVLYGGMGSDTLRGGLGADRIYAVRDTYDDLGPSETDRDVGVSNTLLGGDGDDTLFGGAGNDIFDGGAGNDIMIGEPSYSVDDQDYFYGSTGRDTINGGGGTDTVDYSNMTGGIDLEYTPYSTQTTRDKVTKASGNYDTIYQSEVYIGTNFDDTATGDTEDNDFTGLNGDDVFEGGEGADSFNGGNGTDTALFNNATSRVIVDLQNNALNFGEAVGDTYTAVENLTGSSFNDQLRGNNLDNSFVGGSFSDRLYGRAGDDILDGETGADAIYGNSGVDVMTGGADTLRDRFIYFNMSETGVGNGNRDIITDFTSTEDRIEISRFDADTTTAGNQAFTFVATAGFSGAAGELRYENNASDTLIQGDIDGDMVADFEIQLSGVLSLDAVDFLL